MADNFIWLGGSGSFGVAGNWEDQTAGTNPAATPPGATDTAEFTTGPGTITGTGTVANLQFLGALAWTIGGNAGITDTAAFLENDALTIQSGATVANAGTSDVIDSNNTATTASLLVTGAGSDFAVTGPGTWLYVGTAGNGSLSIANGASATADFLIALGGFLGSSTVRVDGTSRLEIGTAGTATAGALTIDPVTDGITYQLQGYGTVAATVVNNGLVSASANAMDAPLEITGTVTGSGNLSISNGFQNSPGTIVPGAILQLDAAVGASQQVVFSYSSNANESPKLRLDDASAFAGTLANFSSPGDTLELVGDTVTGATVSGSTMTVTLSSGGPLTFNLGFGAPTTSQLLISGSDIRVLPIREFDWTGASGGNFSNALNWNDTTDGVDPAATPPGATDLASITNAGSVSGTGRVYQLSFTGTNSVTGSLTAIDSLAGTGGSLAVTGTLNVASATITGALSAKNGGRVTSSGSVVLQPNALLSVDGSSFVEVGTAGTAVAGTLTVDDTGGTSISGDGTLAAATVSNNGHITVNYGTIGSNSLEVTGAVTGDGGWELTNGYNAGPGTVVPGAILRFDSSVSGQQQVTFDYSTDPGTGGTLQLVDPLTFTGTLDYFRYPGDTLDLVGKSVTGATINGSTMTVSLTAGGPLTFNLAGGLPTSSELIAVGSDVRILPDRLFDWTGAGNSSFSNAANWDDTSDGVNPAATPPGTTDIAAFVNAGAVSGNGTVYQLSFQGSNTVAGAVTALDSLSMYSGSLAVTGVLTAADILNLATISATSGGKITSSGAVTMVAGGLISVDAGSSMEVGTSGTGTIGHLTVDGTAGASITADGTLAAAIVNNGEIDAAGGTPGSNVLEITGALTGGGTVEADHGYHAGTVLVPGGVLRLDSSVGASQSVQFDGDSDPSESATVVLMDPLAFAGTLSSFAAPGDTLELNGQSLTGATVSGSTMTVTRAAGSPLLFSLGGFMPTTNQLLATGSDVRVVPIRELDWTGASGNAFGNALNWDDVTDGLNPADTAPGQEDFASLTNAGSVTGNATVYQLSFAGTNTLTGTLTALNSLTANDGSLVVTGSMSAASMSVLGTVAAKSGGRISSSGTVVLSPGGAIAVDGASLMEVGTAGGAAAGALTIDAAGAGLSGDGTLAAAVVNNAVITAVSGNTAGNSLEITGAVTGTGAIAVQNGFNGAGGTTIPGAVLRFDAAVVSSQQIEFGSTSNSAEEPALVLADPAAFAGTIDNFNVGGDTLELVGETVTGASVSGTTMTVTLAAGGPLNFNLGFGVPATSQLFANGSDIRIVPLRQLTWTGASDTNFGNALNWNDTSDGLDPAAAAPTLDDFATLANAGSISGTGTAYQLSFSGTNTVTGTLTAVNSVSANSGSLVVTGMLNTASITVSGDLTAGSGGHVASSGLVQISPGASIAVDGTSFMEIGTAGTGTAAHLTVDALSGAALIGDGTLAAPVVNNGQIGANSGTAGSNELEITGALTGGGGVSINGGSNPSANVFVPGAILQLDSSVAGTQTILFNFNGDPREAPTLALADPVQFGGTVSTFVSPGDTVDLVGRTVTGASITGATMTVTVTGGGPFLFNLANTPSSTPLSFSGSDVTVAPCFAAGTMILTNRGEAAVESLREGDIVLTHLGDPRVVRWVGHRRIDISRHAEPARVRPIRIAAGAFPDGAPHRDLLVSPDHALFIDDMLIPAKLLVNGASIVVEEASRRVTYYHVELDEHDVLLAEGLAAESYLDTGNRSGFANCGEPMRLHADFAGEQWMRETYSCAPLIAEPARVEPVWRMLAERAALLGWPAPEQPAMVDDPGLHILAGGLRIDPLSVRDGRYVFAIPGDDAPLRLMSRAARPCDERPWVDDQRRLGVLVRRLIRRHGKDAGEVAMDAPALDRGWNEVEWHHRTPVRWTRGDALLPVRGPGLLEVELAGTLRYAIGAPARAAAIGWGAELRLTA